jgi:alanine racemase
MPIRTVPCDHAHFPGVPRALDNSGGSFLDRGHFDLVRAGIALYGGAPRAGANPMHAVIALEARIAQLRTIPAGTGVGYGLTFRPNVKPASPRSRRLCRWLAPLLGNQGAAYHRRRARTDCGTRIDGQHHARRHRRSGRASLPGAPVELIGPHQSIDDVAADAGTISYEILTQPPLRPDRRPRDGRCAQPGASPNENRVLGSGVIGVTSAWYLAGRTRSTGDRPPARSRAGNQLRQCR